MSVVDIRVAARRVPVVFPATATSPPIVKNLTVIGNIAPPSIEVVGSRITQTGATEPIWGVRSAERQQGVRLLEDLYEAEGNPEGWAKYEKYLRDWAEGKTFASFPRHLLPKKVQDTKAAMEAVDPWSAVNQPNPNVPSTEERKEPEPAKPKDTRR